MRKTLIVLLSASVFLNACNSAAPEAKVDSPKTVNTDSVKMAITAANKLSGEAFAKADSGTFIGLYSKDACINPPNAPQMCSSAGIAGFYRFAYAQMGVRNLLLTTTEVFASNDYATETGTYEVQVADNKTVDKGKYIVLWKNENGTWKMYRDIFNSDNPPPPSTAKK